MLLIVRFMVRHMPLLSKRPVGAHLRHIHGAKGRPACRPPRPQAPPGCVAGKCGAETAGAVFAAGLRVKLACSPRVICASSYQNYSKYRRQPVNSTFASFLGTESADMCKVILMRHAVSTTTKLGSSIHAKAENSRSEGVTALEAPIPFCLSVNGLRRFRL
jgi:hypothetical protein